MCLESSRKLAILAQPTPSPASNRSTNKNNNNDTLYLWVPFSHSFFLLTPFISSVSLEGRGHPELGAGSLQKRLPLYNLSATSARHPPSRDLFITSRSVRYACGTEMGLGATAHHNSPQPPGCRTIISVHTLWSDFGRFP